MRRWETGKGEEDEGEESEREQRELIPHDCSCCNEYCTYYNLHN